MFKQYFQDIQYIEVGPVIGLTIFFVFFIVLIYLVIKADSGFINKMKNLPLDDNSQLDQEQSTQTQP
jgi:cytochrome c oxidase cbb3-type subunit 4